MSTFMSIDNEPNPNDLWSGIGGHFDSFDQILCEFIDNSISNFEANKSFSRTIIISIKELSGGRILTSLEDSGTGIKNLNSAFTIGSKESRETPLNEHGFGMKHALASANPTNNNWKICTRIGDDFDNNSFKKISAPYKLKDFGAYLVKCTEEQWPGMLNGPGTYIEFECSYDLFGTIRQGLRGNYGFSKIVEILSEDLGFIYSNVIKQSKASITLSSENINGETTNIVVGSVEPDWEQFFGIKQGSIDFDLGGGNVKIEYSFGSIKEAAYYKYYKRNMSSSGVEIRINGRIIDYNLFKEIWGIEKHNQYNYLLIQINIVSNNQNALPVTRTSKNGIRQGDEKVEALYEWIKGHLNEPRKSIEDGDEGSLFDKLKDLKKIHLPDPKSVIREQKVYRNIKENVKIDLYIKTDRDVIIYEGKKDKTTIKDVYQLLMYWDGAVLDGIRPTQAILISATHPKSVHALVAYINDMKDLNGNNYHVEIKTWQDEGIDYPALSD